jgi:mono/diheme cytochrome c family protein
MKPIVKFFLSVFTVYIVLRLPAIFGAALPASVFGVYLFFSVIMILLVMTATESGRQEFAQALKKLAKAPPARRVPALLIIPSILGYMTYANFRPSYEPPVGLRIVHPPPPVTIRAYGKTYDISTLKNPLRRFDRASPEFKSLVKEGGVLYFKNCFFCHGAKLDGGGIYAEAMDPRPLPFAGTDTIAQLRESYVFWRVVKGGKGLPKESWPERSAMPAWEERLSEEDVWKAILFLYDFTGNAPREG